MNCEKMMMILLNFNFLFLLMIINESNPSYSVLILGYILIFLCNLIAVISFIYLLSNSLVIRLCDDDTSSSKIKNVLYKLRQTFPRTLKFLKFRRVNIYRIHKLWKQLKKILRNYNSSNLNKKDNHKLSSFNRAQSFISMIVSNYNLKSNQTDQDQQNDLYSQEQMDEKIENIATKFNDLSYKGGANNTQQIIQLQTFSQISSNIFQQK
ncbi:hypothetical protein ABPG73_008434 [Tetrahymena malaccensis]